MEDKHLKKDKIYVVAGPTAVGKTEYSIELAKKLDGEIVSLDSVQVYKYLNIGAAKVSKEEMGGIRHYMIDEVEPSVNLNVKEFKDMANVYIKDILNRGKVPILVGGSGFYIRAILYNTDFLEEDDAETAKIIEKLYDELEVKGIDYLYERLKEIDAESAKTIPKENVKRVIRAIEFYEIHKFPISKHNLEEKMKESYYEYEFYVLNMDRDRLYERINKRVDKMIADGLLLEIKELINMGLSSDLNSMKSIGYAELYDFVKKNEPINDINELNNSDKEELNYLIDKIKQHSRNYAKRQLTWFKAQKNIIWIER